MALVLNLEREGPLARLVLNGRLTSASHRMFREHWEPLVADPEIRSLELEFSAVDYMDSAALGMLLLLKENCENHATELALVGCQGVVRRILEVANADQYLVLR